MLPPRACIILADLHKKKALLRKCFFVFPGLLHAAGVAFSRGLCCYRAESGSDRFLHRLCAKSEPPSTTFERPNGGRCGALCFQNRTTREPQANHARTTREHILRMKRMTTMKDVFARTRAKKRKGTSFDFAFGAAAAALFLLSAASAHAAFAALFYAFFAGCGDREADGLFFRNRIMVSGKADFAHANVNNL